MWWGRARGGRTDDVDELQARIQAEVDRKSPFGLADLAVKGADLMQELGMAPGPQIGKVLAELLEVVLDEPEANVREVLLEKARNHLAANK